MLGDLHMDSEHGGIHWGLRIYVLYTCLRVLQVRRLLMLFTSYGNRAQGGRIMVAKIRVGSLDCTSQEALYCSLFQPILLW